MTEIEQALRQREDAEANRFAMELLIPESFLEADLRKFKTVDIDLLNDKVIKVLAKKYQVSDSVMVARLIQLGHFKMK